MHFCDDVIGHILSVALPFAKNPQFFHVAFRAHTNVCGFILTPSFTQNAPEMHKEEF